MEINDQILIGCDPEIFVGKKGEGIISAHGLIDGDKWNPVPTPVGALQIDGMALEFNIKPAATLRDFLFNIKATMNELERRIKMHSPDFEFRIVPVAHFTQQYMETVPEEAKVLGCTPDYNAYTGKENFPPDGNKTLMRTCSGHIHVGWTEDESTNPDNESHFSDCVNVVKQLDSCLYAVSPLWDTDKERRKLYGAAGAFRPKSYGVEYRVLSNVWLRKQPMQAWIYQATLHAMALLNEGKQLWMDQKTKLYDARTVHKHLVLEYGFPTIPGEKVPTSW